ncbi:putative MFS family arabinose efflux permease [Kutzneria buriramensis]|uniref:Putative MFS family arabinose efflux permease n=1 Tax=Kutzneria buriramensis TaxID=1045776 RepID=A0A3E0HZQ3_9PSEU|nr:putative MFS family arabinose efflux permease [Kutzneria buriramensis]
MSAACDDRSVDRSHPAQRRVLGFLMGTQAVGSIGVGTGITLGALTATTLSGSVAVGGLGATAIAFGAALLAVPVALLAGRFGRRRALASAYGVGVVGAVGCFVSTAVGSWPLLLVALTVFGGGTAATLSARYAAADLAHPGRRAGAMSTVVWATTVGVIAAPNLAAPASAFGAGGPFLVSAAAFLLAGCGVLIGLRPDPLLAGRVAVVVGDSCCGVGASELPRRHTRAEVWQVIGPNVRLALLGVALCNTAMTGMMSMMPVQMTGGGSTLTVVGIVVSVHVTGMYAASPLFGALADRIGRVPVLALGAALVVAGAGVCGMASAHDAPQMAVGMIMLGCGWSAGVVAGSALLTESVPAGLRPSTQGLADLVLNVGGVLGGLLAGLIMSAWSFTVLGLVVGFAALPLLMACMGTTLRPVAPDAEPPAGAQDVGTARMSRVSPGRSVAL